MIKEKEEEEDKKEDIGEIVGLGVGGAALLLGFAKGMELLSLLISRHSF